MPSSLLEKNRLEKEYKKHNFVTRAFIFACIVVVITSIIANYFIVTRKGTEAIEIAELLVKSDVLQANSNAFTQELELLRQTPADFDLTQILPSDEAYTSLTRTLDSFFRAWSTPGNPIVSNSLVYGQPTRDEANDLALLPVTLTVTSSVENFARLLGTLESSGLPGSGLRLIEVRSIALNLTSSEANTINYTLSLNAYFQ